jgi:hypothetical protein
VQDDTPRFVYYHSDTGRLHGKTLFDLTNGSDHPGITIDDLLNKENHWLDITSPSQSEMHAISRVRNNGTVSCISLHMLITNQPLIYK